MFHNSNFMFSILLIGGQKIDVTEEQLKEVLLLIEKRKDVINLPNNRGFARHQFASYMPKEEADFMEKMQLRQKGFFRCKKYSAIHKLGDRCDCSQGKSLTLNHKFIK